MTTTNSSARRGGACVAVAVAMLVICACGSHATATDSTTKPSSPTTPAPSSTVTATGQPLMLRNRVAGFNGRVMDGSVLGESSFCPGGLLRHERGSPDIGFPAVNELRCKDGTVRIGFGPGPDQMEHLVQTSVWRILDGTGRYEGAVGDGRMIVQFEDGQPPRGVETFVGLVVLEKDRS